jgi:hypothetical protein
MDHSDRIECDNGEIRHIDANRFRELTLAEKRELKLADLGISGDN